MIAAIQVFSTGTGSSGMSVAAIMAGWVTGLVGGCAVIRGGGYAVPVITDE
jgi:hypothetical protein